MNHVMRAHLAGSFDLCLTLYHRNDVASHRLRYVNKHQSDRPCSDDRDGVPDFNLSLMESTQHACQRLDHGRFLKTHVRRDSQHVEINNPSWHANVFRGGAIIEQQVFAKIFLMARAVETRLARS